MRFQKRVRLFPGFTLNFSGSGISSTIGPKGASITVGKRGTYVNLGVPGSGLSHRFKAGGGSTSKGNQFNSNFSNSPTSEYQPPGYTSPSYDDIIGSSLLPNTKEEIASGNLSELTSSSMKELKEEVAAAYSNQTTLPIRLQVLEKQFKRLKNQKLLSKFLVYGFFTNYYSKRIESLLFEIETVADQLEASVVPIDIKFDDITASKYNNLVDSFQKLRGCHKIWDVTASQKINQVATRSAAVHGLSMEDASLDYRNLKVLESNVPAFEFENKNGATLFIYPGFIVMLNEDSEFGMIDIAEIDLDYQDANIITESEVPSDAEVVKYVWAKQNKDGSPDKRFVGNYQIPVARYGKLYLTSKSGLNEAYIFSNSKAARDFHDRFEEFQKEFKK